MSNKIPTILIATDNTQDAKVVSGMLVDEYKNVFTSVNPDLSVADFESRKPDVLVLAFNTLEKSERYYLGLYRLSALVHTHPHRTVILCGKDEVHRVYGLCKKDYFDDYILFWPMTHDATRLAMAVHHAVVNLASSQATAVTAEFASQVRRLADLEALLDSHRSAEDEQIEAASTSIASVAREVKSSLSGLSERLAQGEFAGLLEVKDVQGLQLEMDRLHQTQLHHHVHAVTESISSLRSGTQQFRQQCTPHLETVRTLNQLAKKIPLTIMVVDDEDLARKLLATILAAENFELLIAGVCQPSCRLITYDYAAIFSAKFPSTFSSLSVMC
jgi:CheY-like chemotaxis protein